MAFRRIPEAISTMVKIFGPITFVILIYIVLSITITKFIIGCFFDEAKTDPILKEN